MTIIEESFQLAKQQNVLEIRPIALMLLDFQMPRKNGLQVVTELRTFIKGLNMSQFDVVIREPKIVFLTAFASK